MAATYHITRENLLDLIESLGREMKHMCSPYAHPYDDARRAAPYPAKYEACRKAWQGLKNGQDPLIVVRWLLKQAKGVHENQVSLWEHALRGDFAQTEAWFAAPRESHEGWCSSHWVTCNGDFYHVDFGNDLNVPRVERIANKYMPDDRCKTTGARALADLMPNPCTRVRTSVHAS